MTSEIRVNKINNRSGLGTVTYSGTGIIVSGIVTANSFSGPFTDLDVDGHTNLDNVSIAGVTTTTEDIIIGADNKKLKIGAGEELELYQDGNHSNIKHNGGNYLRLLSNAHIMMDAAGSKTVFVGDPNGQSALYFNGSKKLNTLNGGVDITGSLQVDSFHCLGPINLDSDIDVEGHTNLDNVNIAGMTTTTGNLYLDGGNINVGTGVTIEANGQATFSGITTFAGNINLIGELNTDTARIRLPDGMNGGPFTGNLEFGNNRDFVMLHDGHHNYVKANNGNVYITCGGSTLTTLQTNGTVLLNRDLDVDGHTNLDNVSIAGVTTMSGNLSVTGTIETTGSHLKITGAEPRLTFTDTDNNPDFQIWANAQKFSIYDSTNSATRINIDSVGHVCINTTTEGNPNADDFTISFNNQGVSGGDQGRCGMTIRSGSNTSSVAQPGYIYFSDGTSGDNESKGVVAYDHNVDDMYFSTNGVLKLRIKSDGNIVHNSTTALQLAKGTTAQRPSGVDGMIRFNTTLAQTEEYRDSGWHGLSNKSVVSGGTVTTSGGYTIHTFTSSGTLTVTGASKTGVDYLLVAGGGGGGDTRAGGGGGGGMTETTGATLATGSYTITIGAGGAGGTSSANGTDGGATSLGSVASVVGGGGGGGQGKVGRSGGSGGGGSDGQNGASGTSGQGNSGGNSSSSAGGGGGGGKGGAGNSTTGQSLIGGNGGAAGASNYSGSTVNYSGGGGGGSRDNGTYGNGGGGGAGRGGQNNSTGGGQSASANQGGGGGGGARLHGSSGSTYNGGAGGSGIVIIRYLT